MKRVFILKSKAADRETTQEYINFVKQNLDVEVIEYPIGAFAQGKQNQSMILSADIVLVIPPEITDWDEDLVCVGKGQHEDISFAKDRNKIVLVVQTYDKNAYGVEFLVSEISHVDEITEYNWSTDYARYTVSTTNSCVENYEIRYKKSEQMKKQDTRNVVDGLGIDLRQIIKLFEEGKIDIRLNKKGLSLHSAQSQYEMADVITASNTIGDYLEIRWPNGHCNTYYRELLEVVYKETASTPKPKVGNTVKVEENPYDLDTEEVLKVSKEIKSEKYVSSTPVNLLICSINQK